MYGPMVRDLLELKALVYDLLASVTPGADSEHLAVGREPLSAVNRQLEALEQHAEAEAVWRRSLSGQVANLTLSPLTPHPQYGPRRRAVE